MHSNDPQALGVLLAIYGISAVFSGLSGFGFSAIGCLSLAILPPQVGVPMLMGLSLATQAFSFASLWGELRSHVSLGDAHNGVMPYLVGGTAGMPVGLAIHLLDVRYLIAILRLLLLCYSCSL